MPSSSPTVAIIGAGLSGLSLALSLHQQGIPATVYEAREASLDIGGAIMLGPNALRVLDALSVYARIAPLGYHFEELLFRDELDRPVDTFVFGAREKHGYAALRIYRHELIDVLVAMVKEAGIPVEYNRKFSKVVSEDESAVRWEFADGSVGSAGLLVGADGIHSRVRKYLYPDLTPQFTNMIGVTAAVPTAQLRAPADYHIPVTIMSPKHGAFVIAPQRRDGSEVLIGRQRRLQQEHDRQGWDALLADKAWCVDFLREGRDDFPAVVAASVSDIPLAGINLWPFYVVPKLDAWVSAPHARVVILGDAAHAIPPTAGQGVNQAFEDVYTFARLLAKVSRDGDAESAAPLSRALKKWQRGRQHRVDGVLDLNEKLNQRRLPDQVKKGVFEPFDLDWLYCVDFDEQVEEWSKE